MFSTDTPLNGLSLLIANETESLFLTLILTSWDDIGAIKFRHCGRTIQYYEM